MDGNIVIIVVLVVFMIIVVKVVIIKTNLPRRLDGDRSAAAVLAQQVGSAEPKRNFDI